LGRTQITSYFDDMYIVGDPRSVPPPINPADVRDHKLPPGIFVLAEKDSERWEHSTAASIMNKDYRRPDEQGLFWMRFVRYSDIFGNRYISGFCFYFYHPENRFFLAGGS